MKIVSIGSFSFFLGLFSYDNRNIWFIKASELLAQFGVIFM